MSADIQPEPQSAPKQRTWKDLGIRVVSALILLSLCFIPLYFGGWSWAVLIAIFACRMMWEWVRMSDPKPSSLAYVLPIIGAVIAIYFCYMGQFRFAVMAVAAAALVSAIERFPRGGLLWAGLGYLYVIIPCLFIIWLRGADAGFSADGFRKVAFIIVAVIAADTGAYFGGSYFKGKKMAPKLSPNKSWSGFFCGLLAAAILGALSGVVLGFSPLYTAMLAVPLAIFSVAGDFLESGLKRVLKVKDTGGLLPGHGGVLDRVDSLMLTVVVASLALIFYPGIWPH